MLNALEIRRFRNLEELGLEPRPGINLIVGENGSGKTSILEALYFLFRGRSFRERSARALAMEGRGEFSVSAVFRSDGWDRQVRVKRVAGKQSFYLDAKSSSTSGMITGLKPIIYLGPTVADLVNGQPSLRRKWLDFSVFHVKPDERWIWRRFRRALEQRNAALRQGQSDAVLDVLDTELSAAGNVLTGLREDVLAALNRAIREAHGCVFEGQHFELVYRPGWRAGDPFETALHSARATDRRLGYTHVGPHRADLTLSFSGSARCARLSRGQQKMVAIRMLLAQLDLFSLTGASSPALLVDDLSAELGGVARRTVEQWVVETGVQSLFTALPEDAKIWDGICETRFHVKQGRCEPVI